MERGRLDISKNKRGEYVGNILFERKGKSKQITVQGLHVSDETLQGKEVEFELENGQVVKIVCEGRLIFSKKVEKTPVSKDTRRVSTRQKDALSAKAPYNFIPLNSQVVKAEKHPGFDFDFDTYHTDRYTGWIDLEIETKTPLYIRDTLNVEEMRKQEEVERNKSRFINPDFFSPGGKSQIPGSSLRGMVRTMVEIVSFGKFGFFDDKRLYYRGLADVSSLRQEYQQRMSSYDRRRRKAIYKVSAGIIQRKGFNYEIISSKDDYHQILKEEAKKRVKAIGKEYKEFEFYKLDDSYLVVSGSMLNKKKRLDY
jgi:hypothetical protein